MLKEKFKNHRIILASGSPRRQQFLKELDLDFVIILKEVNEVYPHHLKASEITDYLAELKANAFDENLKPQDILITSDTLVWHNGKALGKPKNYHEAFQMLQSLSNSTHEVVTSVCVKTSEQTLIVNDSTFVTFMSLTDEMITYYIDNYQPYDKAGSYGIQEWIGLVGIQSIEGSYANVVGLPTHLVYDCLRKI